ncbi:MAG: DUF6448 family protein [Bacteroidales bacterium]|jgi:hypothetical protein|nr:DUF6448 family protein [Bacteroidales bacterium]
MKTKIKNHLTEGLKSQNKFVSNLKFRILPLLLFSIFFLSSNVTFAHCDSYDGPVIKDAIKALETNNINIVLKWVEKDYEVEITNLFDKTYKLKKDDKEIYEIVEKYFFETLVRLHREGEGAPYTGLKPAGSASQIVKMADNSIETGSVDDLTTKFTAHIEKVVKEKYHKLMELSKVKAESLEKGREYVAAYVDYTHTLEALHAPLEHGSSAHSEHK